MTRSCQPVLSALLLACVLSGMNTLVHAQELSQLWATDGFSNPESVVYDITSDAIYVSSVNGAAMEKDGNGFISKAGPDGALLERDWVSGLNAPMGLAVHGSKLYVADIDTLLEIDVPTAMLTNRYAVADARFLNDVTATDNGDIYVTDMLLNRIHRLHNGQFEVWLESPELESPNGVLAEGDHLIVGAWGVMTEGFNTDRPGHLKIVSLTDKTIRSLGDGSPIGNLDGVEGDASGGYYVTDWKAGTLLHVDPTGKAEVLLNLGEGSADHDFIREEDLILIPMMKDNRLLAYRVNRQE